MATYAKTVTMTFEDIIEIEKLLEANKFDSFSHFFRQAIKDKIKKELDE